MLPPHLRCDAGRGGKAARRFSVGRFPFRSGERRNAEGREAAAAPLMGWGLRGGGGARSGRSGQFGEAALEASAAASSLRPDVSNSFAAPSRSWRVSGGAPARLVAERGAPAAAAGGGCVCAPRAGLRITAAKGFDWAALAAGGLRCVLGLETETKCGRVVLCSDIVSVACAEEAFWGLICFLKHLEMIFAVCVL